MILISLSVFISSLAFILPSMMQPLSLGASIMCLSIFSCMLIGFEVSSWFGYIIFLIFVGGLLVMFSYVAALAPNAFFSHSMNFYLLILSTSVFLVLFSLNSFPSSSKLISITLLSSFSKETMTGMLISSNYNVMILITLAMILLFALIAVVKICFVQEAPLRPFKK